MQHSHPTRRTIAFAYGLVSCLGGLIPASQAAALAPWSGAWAQAGPDRETGATASASDSFAKRVKFRSGYDSWESPGGGGHTTNVHGDATAVAGGSPETLLQIGTKAYVGATGYSYDTVYSGDVTASAGWTDDFVQITLRAGLLMPESIQLQFQYEFYPEVMQPYWSGSGHAYHGDSILQMNDKTIKIGSSYFYSPGYKPEWFDSVTDDYGRAVATLHLDLAVDNSGLSEPFSLSLAAQSSAFSNSSSGLSNFHSNRLSLTGITLADGTSLGSLGYGVTFVSGLTPPTPVPEPASIALWSLIAIVGVAVARHRSRG